MYSLLIVDDEPIIRNGIKKLIDYHSINISDIYEAENGVKALEIVKSNNIDIVLADINMPKMNGLEFAKSAKEHNKSIKIAIITGYDYFEYAVNALRYGVDEYILKPVSKNDIEKILTDLISVIKTDKANLEISTITKGEAVGDSYGQDYKAEIAKIIEEKLSDSSFCLGSLSEEINLNSSYLSRLFKQYYGIPFRDYILQTRINQSKILLLSSNKKIYEVCQDVGFEDPNYFSATFKKATGYTPNGYRKHVKDE